MIIQLKAGETEEVDEEVAKFLDFISGLEGNAVPEEFTAGVWINKCYYEKQADGTWQATKCYS